MERPSSFLQEGITGWNPIHQRRAWVDLIGTLLFLFPVCIYIFSMSLDYVLLSWSINEASSESGGLPGLFLLKSLILVMPILMMLQGLAWILRRTLFLYTTVHDND